MGSKIVVGCGMQDVRPSLITSHSIRSPSLSNRDIMRKPREAYLISRVQHISSARLKQEDEMFFYCIFVSLPQSKTYLIHESLALTRRIRRGSRNEEGCLVTPDPYTGRQPRRHASMVTLNLIEYMFSSGLRHVKRPVH